MLDKIKGALFGVAIGDALGATTEFMTKEEIKEQYGKVTEIVGGGYWQLKAGEVTDDTDMTIAVVKGIMANSINPIEEIGKQFKHWEDTDPPDIGITIRTTFNLYKDNWFEAAKEAHYFLNERSAGNGSLMRCLPIALAYSDHKKIEELSILQSKMTHYDDMAAEACVIYNKIAKRILEGEDLKAAITAEIKNTRYEDNYDKEPTCKPDGFVVHTMQWVLYWLLNCDTFEDVVVGATNMGGDSDTIAAIAGGLKGLDVGYSKLPVQYKANLLNSKDLIDYGTILQLIRDKDTQKIKQSSHEIINELKSQVKELYDLVDDLDIKKKPIRNEEIDLTSIKKNIYLFKLSFTEDDSNYEEKNHTWKMAVNHFLRTNRLLDLGAPSIIVLNEVRWLLIMTEHMFLRFQGIEPKFSKEEKEELEDAIRFEKMIEESWKK